MMNTAPRARLVAASTLAVLLLTAACESKDSKPAPSGKSAVNATPPAALPAGLFLAAAPADAKTVEEAKAAAKPGDPIVVRGRVGGAIDPFVSGRTVFTIMGPGLKSCSDNPGDQCATPWDYCCETKDQIAEHAATVQILDAAGAPFKADLKGQHGIKELSDLIIVGKVASAEGKLLIVSATGIYVATP